MFITIIFNLDKCNYHQHIILDFYAKLTDNYLLQHVCDFLDRVQLLTQELLSQGLFALRFTPVFFGGVCVSNILSFLCCPIMCLYVLNFCSTYDTRRGTRVANTAISHK